MQPSYQASQPQPQWSTQSSQPYYQPVQAPPQQFGQSPIQQQPGGVIQQPGLPQQQPGAQTLQQQTLPFPQQSSQPQAFAQQPAPLSPQSPAYQPGQPPVQGQFPFEQQPIAAPQGQPQAPWSGASQVLSELGQPQPVPPQTPVTARQLGQGQRLPASPFGQQPAGQPSVPFQQTGLGLGQEQGALPQQLAQGQEEPPGTPLADVYDSPESITVFVDLPGFDQESIQLQASGNVLHVSATRPEQASEEDRPVQRERRGRVERTITLPTAVAVEEAEASFEDGVCKITLPKSEEDQQQSIAFQ